MGNETEKERTRLERELAALQAGIDAAYVDKLDNKITEEFWQRKQSDPQTEELRIKSRIGGLSEDTSSERLLNLQRILELAKGAYFFTLRGNRRNIPNCSESYF